MHEYVRLAEYRYMNMHCIGSGILVSVIVYMPVSSIIALHVVCIHQVDPSLDASSPSVHSLLPVLGVRAFVAPKIAGL